jgi:hypothetical protein
MTPDDLHAAWLAAAEYYEAKGRREASVELACEWLHAEATRWTEQAVTLAEARHGAGWKSEIRAQAEGGA